MSEYQYYEFLAIDRPLTEREMQELRAVSSRAVITATRFTNHYEWGNFKGDPRAWMERYFDAFLYFANWGTHEFMLRLPRRVLEPATARRYCCGQAASARVKGEHVILEFLSEEEGSDWFEEDEDGSLSSLVPLRAEIASGDLRALYLGWLLCAQAGELDDGDQEPSCPPGSAGSARHSRPSSRSCASTVTSSRSRWRAARKRRRPFRPRTWSAGSRACWRRRRPHCSCGS